MLAIIICATIGMALEIHFHDTDADCGIPPVYGGIMTTIAGAIIGVLIASIVTVAVAGKNTLKTKNEIKSIEITNTVKRWMRSHQKQLKN